MLARSGLALVAVSSLLLLSGQAMADGNINVKIYSDINPSTRSCGGALDTTAHMQSGNVLLSPLKGGGYTVKISLHDFAPNTTYALNDICVAHLSETIQTDKKGDGSVSFFFMPNIGDTYLVFDGYLANQADQGVLTPGYFESGQIIFRVEHKNDSHPPKPGCDQVHVNKDGGNGDDEENCPTPTPAPAPAPAPMIPPTIPVS